MLYRDAHKYRRSRLEEELCANHLSGLGRIAKGKELSVCAVAFLPNAAPDDTATAQITLAHENGVVFGRYGSAVVAANLGSGTAQADAFGYRASLAQLETAVFEGE